MEYTPQRVLQLVAGVPWGTGEKLRVFWVRCADGGRDAFAQEVNIRSGAEAIVPLVIRETSFFNANAVMSDVNRIIDSNKMKFGQGPAVGAERISILLLAKDDFRLPQFSSPIRLPTWFPILAGLETQFRIADLGLQAEVSLLNCEELRIESISELFFELENALVTCLESINVSDNVRLQKLIAAITRNENADAAKEVLAFRAHLDSIADKRAYRPNAGDSPALSTRLIKQVLNSSPKQIGAFASVLASEIMNQSRATLRPPLLAIMLRTAAKMSSDQGNWHAILLAMYQAYQMLNAAAHAGEYPSYSIALLHANSRDLRRALQDARYFVDGLVPNA
jgi:hypothetical protein